MFFLISLIIYAIAFIKTKKDKVMFKDELDTMGRIMKIVDDPVPDKNGVYTHHYEVQINYRGKEMTLKTSSTHLYLEGQYVKYVIRGTQLSIVEAYKEKCFIDSSGFWILIPSIIALVISIILIDEKEVLRMFVSYDQASYIAYDYGVLINAIALALYIGGIVVMSQYVKASKPLHPRKGMICEIEAVVTDVRYRYHKGRISGINVWIKYTVHNVQKSGYVGTPLSAQIQPGKIIKVLYNERTGQIRYKSH